MRCLVTLIDVSDEEFLAHESVCVSISELAGSFHGGLDDDYRESLMELLFKLPKDRVFLQKCKEAILEQIAVLHNDKRFRSVGIIPDVDEN